MLRRALTFSQAYKEVAVKIAPVWREALKEGGPLYFSILGELVHKIEKRKPIAAGGAGSSPAKGNRTPEKTAEDKAAWHYLSPSSYGR
jgi:hypothetical protein